MRSTDDIIGDVAHIVDALMAYRRIMELPDCNTCGDSRACVYAPKPGETVRINCPLWVEENFENSEK